MAQAGQRVRGADKVTQERHREAGHSTTVDSAAATDIRVADLVIGGLDAQQHLVWAIDLHRHAARVGPGDVDFSVGSQKQIETFDQGIAALLHALLDRQGRFSEQVLIGWLGVAGQHDFPAALQVARAVVADGGAKSRHHVAARQCEYWRIAIGGLEGNTHVKQRERTGGAAPAHQAGDDHEAVSSAATELPYIKKVGLLPRLGVLVGAPCHGRGNRHDVGQIALRAV